MIMMAHSLARARGAAAFFQGSLALRKQESFRAAGLCHEPFLPGLRCHELPSVLRRWDSQCANQRVSHIQAAKKGGDLEVFPSKEFSKNEPSGHSVSSRGIKPLPEHASSKVADGGVVQVVPSATRADACSSSNGQPETSEGSLRRSLERSRDDPSNLEKKGVNLVVIGGGAAGVFGAIRAKELCPDLEVVILEKSAPLSKVRISGGGRCNVTTGLHTDPGPLSGQYPRGHKELRGAFFRMHGPKDTAAWFEARGVALKKEDDGRMFPVTNTSATVVDCLLSEVQRLGVKLRNGANVLSVRRSSSGGFEVTLGPVTRPSIMTSDLLMLATGSAQRGYELAGALGHSVVDPHPSLFTFCTPDKDLTALAGISFPCVGGELQLEGHRKPPPGLRQEGPLLITHWGFSGPVVLKLSAWGARNLFDTEYKGSLLVDFFPGLSAADVSAEMLAHRTRSGKKQLGTGGPPSLDLPRRFWLYLLQTQGLDPEGTWANAPGKPLQKLTQSLKRWAFPVAGKGQFKDEFVKAGGVPLKEVTLATMESRTCPGLFLAGELLDVDGVTGGFNFQNAWTGGYIAGSAVAAKAQELLEDCTHLEAEERTPISAAL